MITIHNCYKPELLLENDRAYYNGMEYIKGISAALIHNIENELECDVDLTFFRPLIEEICNRISDKLEDKIGEISESFLVETIDSYMNNPEYSSTEKE